ncbi:MAG: hotdog domain-containing protein [Kosmotogaceae bacterium]
MEKLKNLENRIESFTLNIDEPELRWEEYSSIVVFDLLSTSGLMKLVFKCSLEMLSDYRDENTIFVVSRSEVEHKNPAKLNEELIVELRINEANNSRIYFTGNAKQNNKNIATFSLERVAVTMEHFGRMIE